MQTIKLHSINKNETPVSSLSSRIRVVYTAIGINWQEVHYPSSLAEIEEIKKSYSEKYQADEIEFLIQDELS